jgi:hypothetical protein
MENEDGILPPTRSLGDWLWLIDGEHLVQINRTRPDTEEEARAVLASVSED